MVRGYLSSCVVGAVMVVLWSGCHRSTPPAGPAVNQAGRSADAAPTTAEGCRACDGDFGPHGIDPAPRCNCRTHDAGKRCRGKEDCEAECVADAGDREITDPGPPPRGFWVGRCAELRTSFGCHVFLPPRGAQPAPVAFDAAPAQLCVD